MFSIPILFSGSALMLSLTWLRLAAPPRGQWAEVWLTGLGWTDQPLYKQEKRVCNNADDWKDEGMKGWKTDEWRNGAEQFVGNGRRIFFFEIARKKGDYRGYKVEGSLRSKGENKQKNYRFITMSFKQHAQNYRNWGMMWALKRWNEFCRYDHGGGEDTDDQSWLLLCGWRIREPVGPLADPDWRIDLPGGEKRSLQAGQSIRARASYKPQHTG